MDNVGTFVLNFFNAEGDPASEPSCTIDFVRLDGTIILQARGVQFPPQHSFSLPAFPQERNLHCSITPSLYQIDQTQFFTLKEASPTTVETTVFRDPNKWSPQFVSWNSLPPQFTDLKKVIENQFLKLKHGPDIGVMKPSVYDGQMNSPALLLAKMAMLNLFAVLSAQNDPVTGQLWFKFVQQILVLDRERFVAKVSADLFNSIDKILKNLSSFKDQGFFPGEVSLHLDNIPSEFQVTAPMISVKCRYEQGNVQFTMAKASNAQGDCILLDCDMDEHSNIIEHAGDLFKHIFTGGTHPIDIHEYIVHHQKGVDLGYTLRPMDGAASAPVPSAKPKSRKKK
jgi:hypothetical protein